MDIPFCLSRLRTFFKTKGAFINPAMKLLNAPVSKLLQRMQQALYQIGNKINDGTLVHNCAGNALRNFYAILR